MISQKKINFLCIIEYAAVALSGCIFALVAASWISPIFKYAYGYDSSWYTLMGRAITKGYVPYRDFFDLKGPVFFFIEAIGQAIHTDRPGVFIIECVANSVSAVFIWKTAKLFIKKWQGVIVLLCWYFVYFSLLWGGNTCEEYMMPFNLACIYMTLKYCRDEKYSEVETPAFIFGFSAAAMALSKATLAAPIVACAITVIIELIRKKHSGYILKCVLFFFAGAAFIVIPVFAYFAMNHAFSDFIYAAFKFAFKRSTDYYEKFSWSWENNLLICYITLTFGITMHAKETGNYYKKILMIALTLMIYGCLHLGTPYTYYFISLMPLWTYFLIEMFDTINHYPNEEARLRRLLWTEAGFIFIIFCYSKPTFDKVKENISIYNNQDSTYYDGCIATNSMIPVSEKNDVYDLESGMIYYEVNQLIPTNKYPVNLPYFLHLDPRIKTAVLDYLDVRKPKWIISEHMDQFDDDDVKKYVFSHYELAGQSNAEELYRRTE